MSLLVNSKVYLDTNFWIFLLEPPPGLETEIQRLYVEMEEKRVTPVTSALAWAECIVQPVKLDRLDDKAFFDDLFQNFAGLVVQEVSVPILLKAGEIRGRLGVSLADAIHLASAMESACEIFISHDKRLINSAVQAYMAPMMLRGITV